MYHHQFHPFFSKKTHPSDAQLSSQPINSPESFEQPKQPNTLLPLHHRHKLQTPVMLFLSVASLTSVVGYRFYNQPQLAIGTISPETIIAPTTEKIVDDLTTDEERKAALRGIGITPVLKRDAQITEQSLSDLDTFLYQVEQLRQLTGGFPFIEEQAISLVAQRYLRNCKKSEWEAILVALTPPMNVRGRLRNSAMQQAVNELHTYRQQAGESSFENLVQKINIIRKGYQQAQRYFFQEQLNKLSTNYMLTLLELQDEVWEELKQGITQTAKLILTQGISPGLPSNLLQEAVKTQLYFSVPAKTEQVATALLLKTLQPNLVEDIEKTQQKLIQKAEALEPVTIEISQGEIIVQAGKEITHTDFVVLDHFNLSRRAINWEGLSLCGILVGTCVGIFWLIKVRVNQNLRRRDHILLWLFSISVPLLEVFKIPYTSLPAVGFLAGSFYGRNLAVPLISLLTGLVTFSSGIVGWEYLLAGAAGGLLAAVVSGHLRSREELSLLGGGVALTQGGVYLLVKLLIGSNPVTVFYVALPEAVFYSLSGLIWSVVALGLSPYLERLFDVITPIRLAELSNPNRPLLKRLAIEAPGTFQHTLFVASLAEAAARELRCNVELVRAGTLYHDIGKMHDPLGFIENQMGGPNKHDEINDPWKSAQIIKKHVSEGIVMARKHGLPKAIRDFIPEHQGSLLISYFYFQAKQRQQDGGGIAVQEADFRYDGPIPQSKEAGIMMLADGCEAALRSFKETTPEAALALVNKIFRARWREGQLADSGLSKAELKIIAEVFVKVWRQSNHQRIAYPKAALEPNKVQSQA